VIWRFPNRILLIYLTAVLLLLPLALAQTSVTGQWSAVQTWPTTGAGRVPTHVMVLPTGKVFYYSSYGDGTTPHFWDPATNAVTTTPLPGYNIFCSGHSFLSDGKLFVTGGHIDDFVGSIHASIYDPFANTWTRVPDMNAGRWYPTNTTLANGDVLVVSGTINGSASSQVYNETPQVYQRASNSWRTLTSAVLHLQLYPFMFLAPNGKVFLAGWNPDTRYINPSGTGSWSFVANSIHGWRNYGSAVMYGVGKIMIVGGDGDSSTRTPTNTAEVIDLNAATPAWKSVASMANRRRQLNSTVLPDGMVLVTGGSSVSGFDNPAGAVYAAELWNPATNAWTTLASAARYRGYHSFAVLLPDARVLTGGSQLTVTGAANGANAEVFSPPYLFKGARPSITSAPTTVSYGQTALIGTSDSIAKVSWIRLSAVTHAFNQEQRFIPLSFTPATGGINVTFPSSANISPPGYYMLFLLNSAGVPSVAKIIKIGGGAPPPPPGSGTITGKVTNISTGGALSGATVSYSAGSATSDASGNYTLSNVAAGTYNVTGAHTGYLSRSSSVTVTSNTTSTANFALATAGKIAGVVQNSSGAAISGATVKITGGKVATTVNTTTNSTGNYGTSWIAVGSYTITVSKSGFTTQSKTATVNTGATITVNFTMQ
jgi:galactose oxidase